MYWNAKACTIWGLRTKESARQEDATINSEYSTMAKNNCPKLGLKSNPLLSCWSSVSPVLKAILDDNDVGVLCIAKVKFCGDSIQGKFIRL